MTSREKNIAYLKQQYAEPTWENMLSEAANWYRLGLNQKRFDIKIERMQLIDYLKYKIGYCKGLIRQTQQNIRGDKKKSVLIELKAMRKVYKEILDVIEEENFFA